MERKRPRLPDAKAIRIEERRFNSDIHNASPIRLNPCDIVAKADRLAGLVLRRMVMGVLDIVKVSHFKFARGGDH